MDRSLEEVSAQLPRGLWDRLTQIVPSASQATVLGSFTEKSLGCFRLNPLRVATPEAQQEVLVELQALGVACWPMAELPHAYVFAQQHKRLVTQSKAFHDGALYVQNPSSMLAVSALQPKAGEEVLDLAAAPGGKTTLLAVHMANQGRIAAVEPSKSRFFKLQALLKQQGVSIAQCYTHDGRQVGAKTPERFDKVLLDAPCSGDSLLSLADPESLGFWSLKKVKACAYKQYALIRSAWQALKPNGELLYSTCAFSPEENELVVHALLEEDPQAQVLPVELPSAQVHDVADNLIHTGVPWQAGLTAWQGQNLHADLALTRRILPDGLYNGFYLAKLKKTL